jgi:hypothetical protein
MMLITDKKLLLSESSQVLHPYFQTLSAGRVEKTAKNFSRPLIPDGEIKVKSVKTM